MSEKHTPGPWTARLNSWVRWEICYAGGQLAIIAKPDDPASPPPVSETEANARLIAAAPDMLAVLEHLDHCGVLAPVAQDMIRAALAKARGES